MARERKRKEEPRKVQEEARKGMNKETVEPAMPQGIPSRRVIASREETPIVLPSNPPITIKIPIGQKGWTPTTSTPSSQRTPG